MKDPKQLAMWMLAGSFVAATGFFTILGARGARGHLVWLWVFFAQMIAGSGVWIATNLRFKRLHRAGVWSDVELAPLRALLGNRAWSWVTISLFLVAAVISMFAKHFWGMIYVTILPMNTLTSLQSAIMPPVKSGVALVDWTSVKPLHSEHWGEGGLRL